MTTKEELKNYIEQGIITMKKEDFIEYIGRSYIKYPILAFIYIMSIYAVGMFFAFKGVMMFFFATYLPGMLFFLAKSDYDRDHRGRQ